MTTEIVIAVAAFLSAIAGLGIPLAKLWQAAGPVRMSFDDAHCGPA